MNKSLVAVIVYDTAQRVQPTHERPVRMDRTTMLVQEYASVILSDFEDRTTFLCEVAQKGSAADPQICRETRNLIGIKLNPLAVTTAPASVATV
jgi:hypothetical protein